MLERIFKAGKKLILIAILGFISFVLRGTGFYPWLESTLFVNPLPSVFNRWWLVVLLVLLFSLIFYFLVTLLKSRKRLMPRNDEDNSGKTAFQPKIGVRTSLDSIDTVPVTWFVHVANKFSIEHRPDVEDFLSNLSISILPVCLECESGIELFHYTNISLYSCSLDSSHFPNITEQNLGDLEKAANGMAKGLIRRDYDKYWEIYCRD